MPLVDRDRMEDYIWSFIAALIGAFLGSLGTYFTLRFSYKQLFAETVSKNRMDWINVWRENVSKFLACAEVLHDMKPRENSKINNCSLKADLKKEMFEDFKVNFERLAEDAHTEEFVPVIKIDKNTNKKLQYYPSARAAAKDVGISATNIGAVCDQKPHYLSAGGYKWEWAGGDEEE